MEYCDGGSLAPIRRVDIPARQANALRKNRAKLPTFLPSLAMVDSKVNRPPGPNDIILNENPVPIRDRLPGLAKEIATTIDNSLVRNPKDRFPDAGKLLTSLSK